MKPEGSGGRPAEGFDALVLQTRQLSICRNLQRVPRKMPLASWSSIAAFSTNQVAERAAGRGPMRGAAMEARYTQYKEWIAAAGLDNHGYVTNFVEWDAGTSAALEPNLVPYDVEEGISHWVLWHHPDSMDGAAELDPAAEWQIVCRLLGVDLRDDEAIVFQNVPSMRSIPTIAHAHVFLRPRMADEAGTALAAGLAARYNAWRARSPWLGSTSTGDGDVPDVRDADAAR